MLYEFTYLHTWLDTPIKYKDSEQVYGQHLSQSELPVQAQRGTAGQTEQINPFQEGGLKDTAAKNGLFSPCLHSSAADKKS